MAPDVPDVQSKNPRIFRETITFLPSCNYCAMRRDLPGRNRHCFTEFKLERYRLRRCSFRLLNNRWAGRDCSRITRWQPPHGPRIMERGDRPKKLNLATALRKR